MPGSGRMRDIRPGTLRRGVNELALEPGAAAPRFRLPSHTGGHVDLDELLRRARRVVVGFFPMAFTPG